MSFSFETTTDYALVKSILTHPKLWDSLCDDSAPSIEAFQPNPAMTYLLVKDGPEVLGLWALHSHNYICYEIHTCLLPAAWGPRAKAATQEMLSWLWANTNCLRLITNVPAYNRLALRFALAAGMQEFGRNRASYMKTGKLHDLIMLGLSRPEEL